VKKFSYHPTPLPSRRGAEFWKGCALQPTVEGIFMNEIDIKFMQIAMEEAQKSNKDVPVGAVLVCENKIIAKAYNRKELEHDPTSHAEILAIKEASRKLKNWRLNNSVLYVTLEPCPMCAAAILYSRIPKVVFGAYDSLYGAFGSAMNMCELLRFQPEIIGGILEKDCSMVLKAFFENQRKEK
jgi:tRNA(adenine34) deaminase